MDISILKQIFIFNDNLSALDRLVLFGAEMFGTSILLFLGCMSCTVGMSGGFIPLEQMAIGFGMAVMIAIQVFGHISVCHINPVVTITAFLLGKIALIETPIYFLGQFLGAFLGYGLLMSVTPSQHRAMYKIVEIAPNVNETVKILGVCSPSINQELTVFQGLLVEFLLTLMLVWLCCGIWDPRNANKPDSVPLRFGLAIAGLSIGGAPYTGAHMNPARTFAPAAWHGDWDNNWVYWIGPISSAFFGSGIYRVVFMKSKSTSSSEIEI